MEKVCIKCGISKDVNNFHKDKNTSDGYKKYCKDCRRIYDKTTCISCGTPIFNKGLCKDCFNIKRINEPQRICKVNGCGKVYHALGYCQSHVDKFKRYGDPLAIKPRRADYNPNVMNKYKRYAETEKGKIYAKNKSKRQRERHKEKCDARLIAAKTLSILPCIVPNCIELGERHHPDYTKPLEIISLCRKHHMDLHHGRLDINKLKENII